MCVEVGGVAYMYMDEIHVCVAKTLCGKTESQMKNKDRRVVVRVECGQVPGMCPRYTKSTRVQVRMIHMYSHGFDVSLKFHLRFRGIMSFSLKTTN